LDASHLMNDQIIECEETAWRTSEK
jgi:hypothetical protein